MKRPLHQTVSIHHHAGLNGFDVTERTKTLQGDRLNLTKNLRTPAADIFMCSLLRTVVSFLEQRLVQVDWLGFTGVLCLYQRMALVGVPVVLADNTATPSLTAPIISQSASSPVARPAATLTVLALITERVMALLHQHTSAKNTTRKAATSAAPPPPTLLEPSGKKLDAATCQLKCSVLSKNSHVLQLCRCEAGMDLGVVQDSAKPCFALVKCRPLNELWMPTMQCSYSKMRGWSLNTCCYSMRLVIPLKV